MKNALYIHIPFCEKKCFYCSFSVAIAQEHNADRYLDCLHNEATQHASDKLSSLYIGGGTPTQLSVAQLHQLFAMMRDHFILDPHCEIAVEANPENITREKLQCLKEVGVTRISLGVQSWQPATLKFLGRIHDADRARESVRCIRQAGFDNLNIDLMFGFPGQSLTALEADLEELLKQGCEHVSLYNLTVEAPSRFHITGVVGNDPEQNAQLYTHICERLASAGYQQYEVSNFARSGYQSRHNQNYWRGGNYLGLGVSAHSHRDGRRFWNVDRLPEYLQRLESQKSPMVGEEILSARQRFNEALVFGLRCNEGVRLREMSKRYGVALDQEQQQQLTEYCDHGLLLQNDDQVRTTMAGRLVLDTIAADLI